VYKAARGTENRQAPPLEAESESAAGVRCPLDLRFTFAVNNSYLKGPGLLGTP
jgi:hypothetical protein